MPQSKSAYAPWIDDPDPPMPVMSETAIDRAAMSVAQLMGIKTPPSKRGVQPQLKTTDNDFEAGFNEGR